ncbi:MAG TPA: hypothetical protein VGE07_09540 [Herpetosiphonaceae bacterium]
MPIRPELLPPPVAPERLAEAAALVGEILHDHFAGQDPSAALAALNRLTGRGYALQEIVEPCHDGDVAVFAERALLPDPVRVADVSDEELLEIIALVAGCERGEAEIDYWLEFLVRNLPHPAISDLIFWANLTPAEILAAAKAYQPIRL